MNTTKPTAPMVSVEDVAHQANVRNDVIWRLIRHKKLPAAKIGGHWRIRQSDVDRLLRGEL